MNTDLKNFLDGYIKNNALFEKVNVFPLMCGVGKTTYLRYLISDAIREQFGLIIITDRLDNLNGITESEIDDEFNRFIKDNSSKIAILSSDNIKKEWSELYQKPIVLMCTQRYFNLDIATIRALTKTRTKIVFDEKPYILECRRIDIKGLNDIDTALKQGLNDTINQSDKELLTDTFKSINSNLQAILKANERQNIGYKLERSLNPQGLTFNKPELDKFFNTFSIYQPNIAKCDIMAVKSIEAVQKLVREGGVVVSEKKVKKKSDEHYDNYFYVVVNNSDKLTAANANVFVLDGTADISPEYTLNCFNIVDCSNFQRDLSKLKLNIIELNTSKNKITAAGIKTDKYIDNIIKYIKAEPEGYHTLFTYQAIEDEFSKHFTTAHFGNIKGSNAFRNESNIAQVGLRVFPHVLYSMLAGKIITYNRHNDLSNIMCEIDMVDEIMCKFILADLEQNIFRGCIRNETNDKKMNYMLFCNYEHLSTFTNKSSELKGLIDGKKLKNMIYNRYSKLGAEIKFIETPIEFKLLKIQERNTRNETNAQKIINWIMSKPSGYEFKRKDILTELNISVKQFEKIRSENDTIKALLEEYRIKQGLYKKK